MDNQLNLFEDAGHYFFSIDSKGKDFIVYNADIFTLSEEEINSEDLIPLKYLQLTPIIQKLKSEAWSSNCKWFFIIQKEGIYLMNTFDEHFWLCRKKSNKFIEMFIDVISKSVVKKK